MVVQGVRSLVTSSVPVRGGGRGAHGDALLLAGGGHDVGRDGQRLLELLGEIAGARCARTFLYERLFFVGYLSFMRTLSGLSFLHDTRAAVAGVASTTSAISA